MDIKILVATHKPYWMPEDPMYLPIQVGKKLHPEAFGYLGDDTGENISEKNAQYCELTTMYWAWKNLDTDYIGLAHYRRHFAGGSYGRNARSKRNAVLTSAQAAALLEKTDIILPAKRRYYIETNRSHYMHAHRREGLDEAERIIHTLYPAYDEAFQIVMRRTWAHMFNMLIMKKEHYDAYCTWLFAILFELEQRLDIASYDRNEARVCGFVSELLLDVWIEGQKKKYLEVDFIFMEPQNWLKKGYGFLKRKFIGGYF